MRFALVNTKGGVGKTTTAVHLATMLSRKGPTLLIDNDHPQLSAATWEAWRRENGVEGPSPTTTCLVGRAVATEGRALAENYEHTVVDVGGRDSGGLRAALMLAQRAIVPIGLSAIDSAALTDLLEIIAMARDVNPELQVRALITRLDPRTTRDFDNMLDYLKAEGLRAIPASICERVAFRRAFAEGKVVDEMTGSARDAVAVYEMELFYEDVML